MPKNQQYILDIFRILDDAERELHVGLTEFLEDKQALENLVSSTVANLLTYCMEHKIALSLDVSEIVTKLVTKTKEEANGTHPRTD